VATIPDAATGYNTRHAGQLQDSQTVYVASGFVLGTQGAALCRAEAGRKGPPYGRRD